MAGANAKEAIKSVMTSSGRDLEDRKESLNRANADLEATRKKYETAKAASKSSGSGESAELKAAREAFNKAETAQQDAASAVEAAKAMVVQEKRDNGDDDQFFKDVMGTYGGIVRAQVEVIGVDERNARLGLLAKLVTSLPVERQRDSKLLEALAAATTDASKIADVYKRAAEMMAEEERKKAEEEKKKAEEEKKKAEEEKKKEEAAKKGTTSQTAAGKTVTTTTTTKVD